MTTRTGLRGVLSKKGLLGLQLMLWASAPARRSRWATPSADMLLCQILLPEHLRHLLLEAVVPERL